MQHGKHPGGNRQRGFTYIAMLFALAIFGIGLAALGEAWSSVSHRMKENELMQVGAAYVAAIGAYYVRSPGVPKTYPLRLEDLLEDKRFVGTERYLRRLYRDPVSNSAQWGLVKAADGGIAGVYSLSEQATLRRQAAIVADSAPIRGLQYVDWRFVYVAK